MGLTIHYKLSVAKNLSAAVVRELARRTALYERKIGCGEVGEVMRVEADTPFTGLFVRVVREEDRCFGIALLPMRLKWPSRHNIFNIFAASERTQSSPSPPRKVRGLG